MGQTQADFITLRPWREIAKELCREDSIEQVLKLSLELSRALEVQMGPLAEEKKAS